MPRASAHRPLQRTGGSACDRPRSYPRPSRHSDRRRADHRSAARRLYRGTAGARGEPRRRRRRAPGRRERIDGPRRYGRGRSAPQEPQRRPGLPLRDPGQRPARAAGVRSGDGQGGGLAHRVPGQLSRARRVPRAGPFPRTHAVHRYGEISRGRRLPGIRRPPRRFLQCLYRRRPHQLLLRHRAGGVSRGDGPVRPVLHQPAVRRRLRRPGEERRAFGIPAPAQGGRLARPGGDEAGDESRPSRVAIQHRQPGDPRRRRARRAGVVLRDPLLGGPDGAGGPVQRAPRRHGRMDHADLRRHREPAPARRAGSRCRRR